MVVIVGYEKYDTITEQNVIILEQLKVLGTGTNQ